MWKISLLISTGTDTHKYRNLELKKVLTIKKMISIARVHTNRTSNTKISMNIYFIESIKMKRMPASEEIKNSCFIRFLIVIVIVSENKYSEELEKNKLLHLPNEVTRLE